MEQDLSQPSVASKPGPQRGASLGSPARQQQCVARSYGQTGKRTFDIVLATVLLIALIPFFVVIAIAIKLDSRGPVFYRVRRVGYLGRPLRMLKFRKMHDDASGGPLTVDGDPRLTRVGRVLARARIDELPQLWDVLRGRMSIIGPRPEDPAFVELHEARYRQILQVRPGITGLSQIAYKAEATIVDTDSPVDDYVARIMPQKLTLDTLYADSCALRLDLRIIYWTFITVVLHHPVAVNRVTAAMKLRRRRRRTDTDVGSSSPEAMADGSAVLAELSAAPVAMSADA
jgi:lipopolysaccharide/colanic/teichoic acid biosynthesis glycosyltransferase